MITIAPTAGGTERGLLLPRADLRDKIASWIEADRVPELTDYFESAANTYLYPIPSRIDSPAPAIGQLFWPVIGAARYAHAMYLIDGETLSYLQADMSSSNAVTIRFYDDPTDTLEVARSFPMYLLAVRPLDQTTAAARPVVPVTEDDAWVLILVDERYYWNTWTGTSVSESWTPSSWTELLTTLATEMSATTFTLTDTPASAYGSPTARWRGGRMAGRSTAHMLDAAAASCGCRIVKTPTYFGLQRPTSGNRTTLTAAHATLTAASRHNAGGLILSTDIVAGMESSARVYFYDGDNANCPNTARWDAATGGTAPGRAAAWLDIPATSSAGVRAAAATQWASDWGQWQLVPLDAGYTGVVGVPASAFLGHVLVYHDDHTAFTKYARPPLSYTSLYAEGWDCIDIPQYPPDESGSGSGSSGGDVPDEPGDGEDTEEIYDIQCMEGVQVVTRGRVAHIQNLGRIRHYWYDLYETIEGCCACPDGPRTSGSGGSAIPSGSGSCQTNTCAQCPDGMPLYWTTNVGGGVAGAAGCANIPTTGFTLVYSPTAEFSCRWVLELGAGLFCALVYWPTDDLWVMLIEDYSVTPNEILAYWSLPGDQWSCLGPNTMVRQASACVGAFTPNLFPVLTGDTTPCTGGIPSCDYVATAPSLTALASGVPGCFGGICTYDLALAAGPTWVSGGGCAGAGVTLSCAAGVWTLNVSATDAGCLGGVPVDFTATSGTTTPFSLTFMLPECALCGGVGQDLYPLTITVT